MESVNNLKNIIGGTALIIFITGAAVFSLQNASAPTVQTPSNTAGSTAVTSAPSPAAVGTAGGTTAGSVAGPTSYTLADIAAHNSQSSCWSTISGDVYDLTAWIGQHPGGEGAILSICGADGTSAFMGQHGYNGRVNTILASFKIGVLKN